MKNFGKLIATALLLAGFGTAHATLIGDTVTVGHYFPDSATACGGCYQPNITDVVVAAGDSDLVSLGVQGSTSQNYTVNVEADGVIVTFLDDQGWVNNVPFNGLIISDIDWLDPTTTPIGLLINDKPTGYLDSDIVFTGDSIRILFGAAGPNNLFYTGERFDIRFETASVPAPATLGLLMLALAGLRLRRRR